MCKVILLILFSELWGTAGQIFYKIGLRDIETPSLRDHRSYIGFLKKVALTPAIWAGLGFRVGGLIIWLMVLAQANLSFAFPMDSMYYILTMVAARIFLSEKIDRLKLAGTILVISGIIIVAIS
jgi:uncharacterized membrane protein